ncbi:MAG: tRNA (adenosine(37)-N6)-dimethylallyltransferase MiaA, partial [Rhodospirillaceae bacterium]|nr:tRNA (adenosine(37)-N6)-dimethylallyltransferase MiaA [Rhodospirillaceae bacterium]
MDNTILIAGPTASGKSSLAIALAQSLNGIIINADSMQVYRELRLLTARPSAAEEAAVPHRLYGITSAGAPFSVGHWLELVQTEIANARQAGRTAIIVGGSGLYFQALTKGMADIPDIPEAARQMARSKLDELGPAGLHAALAVLDPAMAARLQPTDSQRLVRAYEVIQGTGVSLASWQQRPATTPILPPPWHGFVLNWPRQQLYRRCDERLAAMLDQGALEEVSALAAMNL